MTTPAGWYPDHADSTKQRYWDGSAWSAETVDAEPGQPLIPAGQEPSAPEQPRDVRTAPMEPIAAASVDGPKWYRRHWVQLAAALVIGLTIGGASGSSSAGTSEVAARAATERAVAAEKAASDAQAEAANAKTEAEKSVAAQKARLDATAADLARRSAALGGQEAAAKANEFDGAAGTYLIGSDIKPGTYRATASSGCYWARLSSLDGGVDAIIQNENTDGPFVVRIKATDKALQVQGCGTFTRIGD